MNVVPKLKPPQHKIFIRPDPILAQCFPAYIHYESTLLYKGKEL